MRKRSRPWKMAMFTSLLLVALCNYGGKATALAGNVTVAVESSTNNTIFPRVVYGSSGTPSRDYPAVPPNGRIEISVEHDKLLSLFFATGCSQDESGNLRNCSTGDCPEGGCSAVDQPVATSINYDSGTFTTSTVHGYNFGIDGFFQCVGCDCPPISCIIPLNRCPENLMILGESGSPVGCKAGDGVPSCQDCAAASGFDSRPSPGTTCFDGAILKITVSSPKECAG